MGEIRDWKKLKEKYTYIKMRFNKDSEIEKHIQKVLEKEKLSAYVTRLIEQDRGDEHGKER